uniref:Uncharacterized protein n=1 Tax=viral metagenome TaxID=1070528 RepID=A0A6C0DQ85_9ZZZZ
MISKSIFSNATATAYRPIYNPVDNGVVLRPINASILPPDVVASLEAVELNYTLPMSNKNYEVIPNDYNQYVQLYNILYNIVQTYTDPTLITLLKIAKEALQGAINSYAIYGDNIACKLDALNLQQQVNDCLSNKNEHTVATGSGTMTITRSFKLAPVFNYYIVLYGMPAAGVGFDPIRINFLVNLLIRVGINPYK